MSSLLGRPSHTAPLFAPPVRWVLAVLAAVATLLLGLGALHSMSDTAHTTVVSAGGAHPEYSGQSGHGHGTLSAHESSSGHAILANSDVVGSGASVISAGVGYLGLGHCEGTAGAVCCVAAAACTVVLALLVLSLVARIPPAIHMLFPRLAGLRVRGPVPAPPRSASLTHLCVLRV